MTLLLCLYTCERDRESLMALENSKLMQQVRHNPRFRVLEVHANAALAHPFFHDDRLTVACEESYAHLSLKTYLMITSVLGLEFDFLLKLDSTVARYAEQQHRKSPQLLARLTPDAVLKALGTMDFFGVDYNGLVSQTANQQGFEAWMRTKGLACDYRQVFPAGEPTPPYFLGKFYALRRNFCQYIAQSGEAMAIEHQRYLGGSEDLMIGRLYQRWCMNHQIQ